MLAAASCPVRPEPYGRIKSFPWASDDPNEVSPRGVRGQLIVGFTKQLA